MIVEGGIKMMNTSDKWIVGIIIAIVFIILNRADYVIGYNRGYVDGFDEGNNNCQNEQNEFRLEEVRECKKELSFCREYTNDLREDKICIVNTEEEIRKCKLYNRIGWLE